MDKTLDEIIATRPKQRRPNSRRGSARVAVLGKPVTSPAAKARASAQAATAQTKATQTPQVAEKIIVSNLPPDVNEPQVKELFQQTVGPLKDVTLHYDSNGRSKGVAIIHFVRKGDANKAFSQYNNRLIDGKRPMKIEMLVDPSRPPTLAERVAPAATSEAAAAPAQPRTAGKAKRGRRVRKNERPNKSAADLDAEMEDYTGGGTAPAAAAPAAVTA